MLLLPKCFCLLALALLALTELASSKICYECDAEDSSAPCEPSPSSKEKTCKDTDTCLVIGEGKTARARDCGDSDVLKSLKATPGKCSQVEGDDVAVAVTKIMMAGRRRRRRRQATPGRFAFLGRSMYTVCACDSGDLCNHGMGESGESYSPAPGPSAKKSGGGGADGGASGGKSKSSDSHEDQKNPNQIGGGKGAGGRSLGEGREGEEGTTKGSGSGGLSDGKMVSGIGIGSLIVVIVGRHIY